MTKTVKTLTNRMLQMEADSLETHAKSQLQAWIILGQTGKYDEMLARVSKLRRAMTIRGLRQRAEYLTN
jgi:hypothetical protein